MHCKTYLIISSLNSLTLDSKEFEEVIVEELVKKNRIVEISISREFE